MTSRPSFLERLNGPWHERALQALMVVVLAHWAEHIAQAMQVYVLHWSHMEAGGVLGLWCPWLVHSEALHYIYAIIMLLGIWSVRTGFVGRARTWWMVAFWVQFWHHIEHSLLQGQVIAGTNLFGASEPTSIAQLIVPRIELHLLYNSIVFIPMVIAMYRHLIPTDPERERMRCSCAAHTQPATA